MQLTLKTFTQAVQDMAAGVQASATKLVDLTVGSTLRATLEATASVALWLQWLILQVLQMTRAATSSGSDLDSWMADFNLPRLPAVASSGGITFARFSAATAALIPVGANVKTADGTRTFTVVADATNGAWNGATGFTLAATVASVTCTAIDVTLGTNGNLSVGSAGNVLVGTITLLASAIPGVDTVTNASPFTNGINAESDAAYRSRFANYIQTRSRGTVAAIGAAIASVQQGLTYLILENKLLNGNPQLGNFAVVVNDGSGNPPSPLLAAVSSAIALCRPVGSTWSVNGPSDTTATVVLTISCSPTANKPSLLAPVQAAILAFISALQIGATFPFSRIAAIAYAVDPSIIDVTGVLLNSGTADLVPAASGVVVATSASVTVN